MLTLKLDLFTTQENRVTHHSPPAAACGGLGGANMA